MLDYPALRRRLGLIALVASLAAALPLGAENTTVSHLAAADTYTNPQSPNTNYGTRAYLTLDATSAGAIEDTAHLRFDIPTLPGPVVAATLRVRALDNLGTVTVWSVDYANWEELSLVWANQPARVASITSAAAAKNTNVAFDLSAHLTSYAGGTIAFALTSSSQLAGDLSSREATTAAYRPVLEITYSDSNRAPVAVADSYDAAYQTARDVAAPGLLANDSDPDGDPLTAVLVTGPAHGSLTLNPDGGFIYTPNNGFSGPDSFTYKARDSHTSEGGGISILDSAPVTVTLNVLFTDNVFPTDVLVAYQNDLGVTLTPATQLDLYNIVFPSNIEPWRTAADARIAQHRKAPLILNLVTASNQPAVGATVEFRQKSRPFKFGGVLDLKMLNGISPNQPAVSIANYKARSLALFDAFGLNNGFKPKQMGLASDPNANQNLLPGFLSWSASVNRPVRGHLLIWPGNDHMSTTVTAKVVEIENLMALRDAATDPQVIADYDVQIEARKPELRDLVDAEITDWATRWTVTEWDVLNEPIGNIRITNILGTAERVRWFQLAQAAQPAAGRFINEFQIISANSVGTGGTNRIDTYKNIIAGIVAGTAPITGIGFQSRFTYRREDPALLYSRLEQFVPYGLTLTGTEFEVVERPLNNFYPTEQLRARITEEVMTTYFSHPSVNGLYAWTYIMPEFTEALLDTNGVPKLNGLVWYYMNRIRYATRGTFTADAEGRISLDAFKGDYDLVVTYQGNSITVPLSHGAAGEFTIDTSTGAVISGPPPPTSTTDTTHAATADTYVRTGSFSATNYGAAQSMQLRLSTSPTVDVGRLGYVRYTVPALTAPVVNAVLRFRIPPAGGTGAFSNGETSPLNIHATSADWIESGPGSITWNNKPALGTLLATRAGSADSWLEIVLPPSAIPAGGGSVSFALDEQGNTYGQIMTREYNDAGTGVAVAAYAPQLRVVTATDSIPLALDTDADGFPDAWELLHGLDANTSTSALLDTDGDGRPLRLEFLLGRDPAVAEPLSEDVRIEPSETPGQMRLVFRRSAAGPTAQASLDLISPWTSFQAPEQLTALGVTVHSHTTAAEPGGITRHTFEITPPARVFLRLAQ